MWLRAQAGFLLLIFLFGLGRTCNEPARQAEDLAQWHAGRTRRFVALQPCVVVLKDSCNVHRGTVRTPVFFSFCHHIRFLRICSRWFEKDDSGRRLCWFSREVSGETVRAWGKWWANTYFSLPMRLRRGGRP